MASKGLLVCPSCGARPAEIPAGPAQVISCPFCGVRASAAEWTRSSVINDAVVPDTGVPPVGTRITRREDGSGEVVWSIPASGKSGGLMFFAIFWCAITAIVSGAFLTAFLTGKEMEGDAPGWFLIPFVGIFWGVGFGVLYAACRSKYARHRITAGVDRVTLRRELFGRSKEKSLSAAGISSVTREVFYQKNYRPVFGVQIKGEGAKLRFGSMLTDEEKAWLVADMGRAMMKTVDSHGTPSAALSALPRVRQSYFSVPLPKSRTSLVPMALILIGMGSVFAFVGTKIGSEIVPEVSEDPGGFWIFDRVFNLVTSGFQGIWMLTSGVMMLAGILMLFRHFRSQGKETRLEATESEISIRTFKYGRIIEDRTFPRSSVTDIRCSGSGSSNGKPMKRIELIVGDRAEKIAWWIDGDLADAFVGEVRSALG